MLRLLSAAALAGALLVPATAAADSIVYIDQGNVWSAAPDGSRKVQLTEGGDWHSPTQADDGTVAAVQGGGPISVLARDGRPLRTITTAFQKSSNGGQYPPRPVELSFSPDGTKLAYVYTAYNCKVVATCGVTTSTFYTRADVTTATPVEVYGNQFDVAHPEWITNERTLVFGGAGSQVSIDDLGPGDYSHTAWMTPNADQGDGELSRDLKKLATTFFYGKDTLIAFFAVSGDPRTQTPPAQPELACQTSAGDERHADPSWSPDSSAVAFQSSKGIEVVRFNAVVAGACDVAGEHILTATGSEPDWGPADPPAARYAPPSGTTPVPAPPATGPAPAPVPSAPTLRITTAKATRAALRKGLTVKVDVPSTGKVTAKLLDGRKTVATGKATARRAGALTLRLSKTRSRAKRLALAVTAGTSTVKRTLTIR
ncbi:WD40 repeat protein [Solirubrobacter pauli]|uniref:WD40 repeat protein n=1 Tax=Solirubrobacter pauli TaxID=166793 RepID=A0A660L5E0_9ACTN|nr:PD40 domain-containing protein [Solirubrobacter pauli]RKQ88099.1 WD40 repeat protein [Solirubrobacter pauli]